jgi:hypothetical protein
MILMDEGWPAGTICGGGVLTFNVCLNCSANRKFLILFMFLNNFEVLVIK